MLCVSCDFSLFGEPHEQGLVFKWGSLVGLSLPTTGANETSPFVVADTVFVPNEFTGHITDDWATVPWCDADFTNYGNAATDHLATVHNPALGIGDICRYMGEVDGATWRMPTAKDWEDLYGSAIDNGGKSVKLGGGWIAGNYYPLSGCEQGHINGSCLAALAHIRKPPKKSICKAEKKKLYL